MEHNRQIDKKEAAINFRFIMQHGLLEPKVKPSAHVSARFFSFKIKEQPGCFCKDYYPYQWKKL
jgi:hypothetical protein